MRALGVILISAWLMASLSACSVRPVRSDRKGLLDDFPIRQIVQENPSESSNTSGEPEIQLSGRWVWPLKSVSVSSEYGIRGEKFHQGVDLRAAVGTPVLAASDGIVVYVGTKIRGYGRMIVLKHANNYYSVYAHHSRNLVKVGKKVKAGQRIALSGKSGRARGPHLHFEIRQGTESCDPVYAIRENLSRYASNRKIASELTQ